MIYKSLLKKTPFFIAEISANHNGSLSRCKKLIKIAKDYGADAVKLQTYTPETITINSKKSDFKIKKGLWKGNALWNLYNKAQTPFEWHQKLFDYKPEGTHNALVDVLICLRCYLKIVDGYDFMAETVGDAYNELKNLYTSRL